MPRTIDAAGYNALVGRAQERIQSEDIRKTVVTRLQVLDPAKKPEEGQLVSDQPIKSDEAINAQVRAARVDAIITLMCKADGAPYIARGFIYNGRIVGISNSKLSEADDPALRAIAMLRGEACAGAAGLDRNDFRELSKLAEQVRKTKNRQKGVSADDDDDSDDGKKDDKDK